MTSSLNEAIRRLIDKYVSERISGGATTESLAIVKLGEERQKAHQVSTEIDGVQHHWIAKQTSVEELEALRLLADAEVTGVPEVLMQTVTSEFTLMLIPKYSGSHSTMNSKGWSTTGRVL